MKFITISFTVMIALLSIQSAAADPRIEEDGRCHFLRNVDNSDDEYRYACSNLAAVNTNGDGTADGHVVMERTYFLADGIVGINTLSEYKGDGNTAPGFDTFTTIDNQDCVMVTSNYDAGTNTINYTEYRTRDWNQSVSRVSINPTDRSYTFAYNLACRNAVAQN